MIFALLRRELLEQEQQELQALQERLEQLSRKIPEADPIYRIPKPACCLRAGFLRRACGTIQLC